ncbi:hypothetical protein PJI16_03045 [Nitrospira sp. MA-1]|nr:hypothetical protein [Nitrospira sp. MA-1]
MIEAPVIMALLNKSQKSPKYAREKFKHQQLAGMFKNVIQQGHSHFGARSVPSVRKYDKTATCLREAAPAKAGNATGGFFQHSHYVPSRVRVAFPVEQDQPRPEAV